MAFTFRIGPRSNRSRSRVLGRRRRMRGGGSWAGLVVLLESLPARDLAEARRVLTDDLKAAWRPRRWRELASLFKGA